MKEKEQINKYIKFTYQLKKPRFTAFVGRNK
jgi:hypothetical protein